ncbi:MAG TPA: cytochrome c [Terracidiphilus sp.]|jgi:mono/diheme cytochrome c family protein|nr:cytochrome c [Terracidiphilus sp.]
MMRKAVTIWAALSLAVFVIAAIACVAIWSGGLGVRPHPPAFEASLAMSALDSSIPSRYSKLKNPLATVDMKDAAGHYEEHCAVCHADDGSGHTKFHGTMDPPPTDLRSQDTQEMPDGELYWIVKNGVRWSGMPAFGAPGDNDEHAWKIVAFVRHLPSLTPDELKAMKAGGDDDDHGDHGDHQH